MNIRSLFPLASDSTSGRHLQDNPFAMLQREMNRLFDDRFRDVGWPRFGGSDGMLAPVVDVKENEAEYVVTAELPGVDQKEIDLSFTDGVLTIKGEKRQERSEEKEGYHLMERSYGSFARTLEIPAPVQTDGIKAEFTKGVLTIVLPKSPDTAQKTQKINIGGGGSER